jgi:hypothetical protein
MLGAVRWIVDGNNVMGARPDGWWRDRAGAARRLTRQIVTWQATHGDPVLVVFDGPDRPEVRALADAGDGAGAAPVVVRFAPGPGPDAADTAIVEELAGAPAGGEPVVVVTADRGLVARLPAGTGVEGPARFLERVAPR